jgi:hypothetical protein
MLNPTSDFTEERFHSDYIRTIEELQAKILELEKTIDDN